MAFSYPYGESPDAYVDELGGNGGTVFLADQSSIGRAVFYTDGTYRTILSAVIYGALRQPAFNREQLLAAYVNYLLHGTAVTELPTAPGPAIEFGPNPVRAGGRLHIRSAAGTAALYDAFGRKLAERKVSGYTVWRLDGLPAGSYMLRLTAEGASVSRPLVVCR